MDMNPVASSGRLPHETRERILRGFEAWLDSALGGEEPPQGVAGDLLAVLAAGDPLPPMEGQCDLYSLWSAMTALTQEVKLQSRTFRQLYDTLSQGTGNSGGVAASPLSVPQAVTEERLAAPPETERRSQKKQLDLLLDLRDRLDRGIRSVREAEAQLVAASPRSFWARWLGGDRGRMRQTQDTLAALEKGYALTLDRLDQGLQDSHLSPILCEGQVFDPHRMTAVELEETDAVPEGTVVGVYRSGYEWEGEVYRSAQVKVARAPREPAPKEREI
jgi:molecular chaperone GrpE